MPPHVSPAPPQGQHAQHLLPHSRSRSPYSSHGNEADDELSSSSSDAMMHSPHRRHPQRQHPQTHTPSYPGQDTSPTSKRELLGFYTYSFAAEVFVVCGLGAFIPIILEELARASATAVLVSDSSRPCITATGTGISDLTQTSLASASTVGSSSSSSGQCTITLPGSIRINTASFAMYTFSLSVLLQALVVVTMSGAADHGVFRKKLLIVFAVLGAVATMLFVFVTPEWYLLGALWAVIGNVGFGASFVLLNSFLPVMVRWHPEVLGREDQVGSGHGERLEDESDSSSQDEPSLSDVLDPTTALLSSSEQITPYPPSPALPSTEMQLSTKISANGIGIGYTAAVIVQLLSIIILHTIHPTLLSLRLVLLLIGLWWLLFTIPAAFYLRARPGPPLAHNAWHAYLTHSWRTLARTILRARKLKDTLLFLTAWFLLSDAIATVSSTAILFAKTTLLMSPSALALINVTVTLSGIAGALLWPRISHLLHLTPPQTILACTALFELIPLYGLLPYVPTIRRLGVLGLQQSWEMYPLALLFGFVLGGLGSYCRALFGELIPPGSEAAFYALYALTDKGSSVFGPAVVGAITDRYGEIRPAFLFLAVLVGLPVPILGVVDVERGRREARGLGRVRRDGMEGYGTGGA